MRVPLVGNWLGPLPVVAAHWRVLLTVAGSSCSGKSTAAVGCAGLAGVVVHDFDEIGVPSTADTGWRQRSTEQWLQRVLDYQQRGLDVLLLGQSPLGEVLACPSAIHLDGIAACLLDVADDERLRRLEGCDPGRCPSDAQRSLIGWGRWHCGHAADPRHRPEVITSGGWSAMLWQRWSHWTRGDPRWAVTVIDTTAQTVPQSTAQLQRWVTAARADHAHGRLPLRQGWARQ